MKLNFRKLKADEIDVRIKSVTDKGVILLLFKDARVDQNLLDETVGPMYWQRDHKELKGNIYCGISIYDDELKQWVTKWDCGKESNTEAEKGEASDSFKRAGFNWGIGRELYTSPLIWVSNENCNITSDSKGNFKCYDRFFVKEIEYKDDVISKLLIINLKTKKAVFTYGIKTAEDEKEKVEKATPVQIEKIKELFSEEEQIKALEIVKKDKLEDLTIIEASQLIAKKGGK